jgi:putative membrane protein
MGEMIKAEFCNLFKNHILLLSVSVICLLPFLYSIFFLKSVWDPYGSTQDLPIAVVNKDVPVEYQGRKMNVGQQTVNQLRHNHQMKWEIVSQKKAQYGISHRQYYAVITIPKNFSEDATTVMEKHPKTMKLHYETNGSLNYIGQVMTQIGTTRLNSRIRSQVTKAYATAMFKEFHVVGKGMTKAADGAQQLSTGLVTLNDGVNRYVAGVYQVNNGVQQLRMSVAPLASGAQQLASGSQTLAAGIQQYTGGVGQLASGLGLLQANSGQLSSGASQLAGGLNTLSGNSAALQSGANQLAAGNTELNNQVNSLLPQLQSQMGAMSGDISAKGQALNAALQPIAQSSNQLKELSGQLGTISAGLEQLKQAASAGASSTTTTTNNGSNNSSQLQAAAADLNGVEAKNPADQAKIEAAKAAISAAASSSNNSTTTQKSTDNGQSAKLVGQISQLQAGVNRLKAAVDQSANSAGQNTANVQKAAADLQNSLLNMQNGTSAALTSASGRLTSATQQLANGANTLNSGIGQYTNGVATAAAGANTLSSGIGQYTAGVAQAGAGANQLVANSGALNAGAGQLASALGQLNAQVPALISGVNLLASGTQQLADNSPALISGITQLNNGAGRLASSLAAGAKAINNVKPTNKTAKMFAEPTTVKHKNYSYVPNYGHALAPYVLSVALYVGILVFNFIYPIRRVAVEGKSAVSWWISKVVVGAVAVTLMAIIEDAVMLAVGLTTDHIASMFATSICFGLASMAIVMFLSMTFDNPGRFVAMVLLMLQLGGSGGTFPMEVTMKFYNVIHWFLPMTYSILGLRQSISSGIGAHYAMFCNLVLLGIAVLFNLLLLAGMLGIHHHLFNINPKLDKNQKFLDEMEDDGGIQSK